MLDVFIDSAKLGEIEQAYAWGVCSGVTTNPSLLKKAVEELKKKGQKIDLKMYIKKILRVAKGTPVSLEVTESSAKGMIRQGVKLFKLFNPVARNVYIKIPVNPSFKGESGREHEGLEAIRALSRKKIPVNCTLIFTPEQALLAAKAGAALVSPFAGRIDDDLRKRAKVKFEKPDYFPAEGMERRGRLLHDNGIISGIDLVAQTVEIFRLHKVKARVLAASMRNTRQVREAALAGADIATLPLGVIRQLLVHHKTEEGMEKFTADAPSEYVKLAR